MIDIDEDEEIIFSDGLTIDHIVWMNTQPTLKERDQRVGVGITILSADIIGYLYKAVQKGQAIRYLPPYHAEHKPKLADWPGVPPVHQKELVPFIRVVIAQRNYKSTEEVIETEKACNITAGMHTMAMKILRPDIRGWEVSAAMEAVAHAVGSDLSFATIATANEQAFHNRYHGSTVKPGDLFPIDAGAEMKMGYIGGMSSIILTDKKFTQRQREVYKIQNAIYPGSVKALRPGIPYINVYDLLARVMVEGLKGLGLMKENAEGALREGTYALFCPHELGHMMGFDVHDMENLGEFWVSYNGQPKSTQLGHKLQRLAIPLEPSFVHTVEPDIYFIPELIDLWKGQKKFADSINYDKMEAYKDSGGIHNERDYLITETGVRRLGKKIPLTPDEVEALR